MQQRQAGASVKTVLTTVGGMLVGALAVGVLLLSGVLSREDPGVDTESRNEQIVQAVEREQEVVLLSLGIQGIAEERIASTVLGRDVPGTSRVLFLQYNFRAKLGIDGSGVIIEPRGESAILVSVPAFEVIGHDEVTFRTAVEDNGVLSWLTPDIDTAALITQIMNDDALQEHVDNNEDILEDQARAFYTSIITAVDPELRVVVEFRGDRN